MHSAPREAVAKGASNVLTFRTPGDNASFFANDIEVAQIPLSDLVPGSRRTTGPMALGLGAFGIGAYHFEAVETYRP